MTTAIALLLCTVFAALVLFSLEKVPADVTALGIALTILIHIICIGFAALSWPVQALP